MIKTVIDTNIFILSFWGGDPEKIIHLWHGGESMLCLTPSIIEEYVAVLQRLGLQTDKELQELLHLFSKGFNCIFTTKTPKLSIVKRDPADNKFIECAAAHQAKFIITGDNALLEIKNYVGTQILNPKQFLEHKKIMFIIIN